MLAYAVFYYHAKLDINDSVATLIYFVYTLVMVFGFWLLTGAIGFISSMVPTQTLEMVFIPLEFSCARYGRLCAYVRTSL